MPKQKTGTEAANQKEWPELQTNVLVGIRGNAGACKGCGGRLRTGRFYCSSRCYGLSRIKKDKPIIPKRIYGLKITSRLAEVLNSFEIGCVSNDDIAARLGVNRTTLKGRMSRLFIITGCKNRAELAVWHLTRKEKDDILFT